jgi:hypothetical protein
LRAIYIRFSNAVKQKFGCNSIFTLQRLLDAVCGGYFDDRSRLPIGCQSKESGLEHY